MKHDLLALSSKKSRQNLQLSLPTFSSPFYRYKQTSTTVKSLQHCEEFSVWLKTWWIWIDSALADDHRDCSSPYMYQLSNSRQFCYQVSFYRITYTSACSAQKLDVVTRNIIYQYANFQPNLIGSCWDTLYSDWDKQTQLNPPTTAELQVANT